MVAHVIIVSAPVHRIGFFDFLIIRLGLDLGSDLRVGIGDWDLDLGLTIELKTDAR